MAGKITQPRKGPSIRPADASVFKKSRGERKYNAAVKFLNIVSQILNFRGDIPADLAGDQPGRPVFPEIDQKTIATIEGYFKLIENNLIDPLVLDHLNKSVGEEQAVQTLQNMTMSLQELKLLFDRIKNSIIDQPKEEVK